ncbi:UPF0146 family protein [Archaeoglobus neptunius]|uniref:UPF0146 family protein n=1 Tax=Archaeoglobus neptunius TaxID=2798580 RepID=UPI00192769BE|nr:UPF0146 family protein [Archaeoglobus neptunius]
MLRLAEFIAGRYRGKVVEVGIGNFTAVAEMLAKSGLHVVATDVVRRKVPDGVGFFVDDINSPRLWIYDKASLVYSIRPPPEIVPAILRVAGEIGADCIVKPLYGDHFDGKLFNYRGLAFYYWGREHDKGD